MNRKLSQREKLSLGLLVIAGLLAFLLNGGFGLPGLASVSESQIAGAENTYMTTRVHARQELLVAAEAAAAQQQLAKLEEGLLDAADAALAQAEMRTLLGELLTSEGIGMDSSRFERLDREQEYYARVPLSVVFRCSIEQLVNFMTSLANAPKLLTPRQVQISPSNPQTKFIQVTLTVAGYLPVERTPELAGGSR